MSKWNETIQQLETSPGWLDRNIQEAKKSLPPTEDQLAAARLAGKVEGMELAATLCEDRASRHGWNYHLPSVGRELGHAIRARITELQATTTPASPGSSDEKSTAE